MAAVLKITNGTDEVNLLDPTALYVSSWFQQLARKLASGEYTDVPEVIKCAWMEETDDARDATIQSLYQLAEEVYQFRDQKKLTDWVWLEARTHSETNSRYAILNDLFTAELSKRHWGPDGPVDVAVQLRREGLWRYVAPNGTPATAVSATTIYNKQDADGNNYVTISNTDAKGDAPGLLIFEMDPGATTPLPKHYIIAQKTATNTSDLDDFVPHLDSNLELDNVGKRVADVEGPEDLAIEMTTDTTLRWNLTAAARKLSNYAGEYLIYAILNQTAGGGSATAQFQHGQNYVAGPAVTIDSPGSPGKAHYLGRTTIPGGIYNPALTDADYDLKLNIDITGTATIKFFDLWLVPISEVTPFVIREAFLDSGVLVANGNLEKVYEQTTGAVYQQTSTTPPEPGGRYLQCKPGRYNRFYFFWTALGDLAVPNHDLSVTVKLISRCRALRGNT